MTKAHGVKYWVSNSHRVQRKFPMRIARARSDLNTGAPTATRDARRVAPNTSRDRAAATGAPASLPGLPYGG